MKTHVIPDLERCEFDDECDFCKSPQGGSFTRLIHNAEDCTEAEFYICGDCVHKAIDRFTKPAPQAQPSPTLADDTFADKAIAQMSIALAETPAGTLTNAVQLLVRPIDVRGDESGAHPGESFVMATITREEVRAMQASLNTDWEDHLRCTQPKATKVEPSVQEPVCSKDPQSCWNVRCQLGKKCKNTLTAEVSPS